MANRYSYATTLRFGADGTPEYTEMEVELSYTVEWGDPGSGRPYFGPPENYSEPTDDEVHDIRIERVDGKSAPFPHFASDHDAEVLIIEALTAADDEAMLEHARDATWGDTA